MPYRIRSCFYLQLTVEGSPEFFALPATPIDRHIIEQLSRRMTKAWVLNPNACLEVVGFKINRIRIKPAVIAITFRMKSCLDSWIRTDNKFVHETPDVGANRAMKALGQTRGGENVLRTSERANDVYFDATGLWAACRSSAVVCSGPEPVSTSMAVIGHLQTFGMTCGNTAALYHFRSAGSHHAASRVRHDDAPRGAAWHLGVSFGRGQAISNLRRDVLGHVRFCRCVRTSSLAGAQLAERQPARRGAETALGPPLPQLPWRSSARSSR